VKDLFDTMYGAEGVGLAACQIGVSARVLVLDCSALVPGSPQLAVINPEVMSNNGPVAEEGCPPPRLVSRRISTGFASVRFDWPTGPGRTRATGLPARAFLHELDHLDGVLFVDHQSAARRMLLAARLWGYKRRSRRGDLV
jgi:peptide deformylase